MPRRTTGSVYRTARVWLTNVPRARRSVRPSVRRPQASEDLLAEIQAIDLDDARLNAAADPATASEIERDLA